MRIDLYRVRQVLAWIVFFMVVAAVLLFVAWVAMGAVVTAASFQIEPLLTR